MNKAKYIALFSSLALVTVIMSATIPFSSAQDSSAAGEAVNTQDNNFRGMWGKAKGVRPELTQEQKDEVKAKMEERRAGMEERKAKMTEIIENKDYDAWYALMSADDRNPKMLELINKDNFDRFTEMHELMKDGKFEEAKAIGAELGLEGKMGKGHRGGMFNKGLKRGMGFMKDGNCICE